MRNYKILILLFILFMSFGFNKTLNRQKIPKDAIKGDFNGDNVLDFMWLEKPKFPKPTKDTQEGDLYGVCDGNCDSYIVFSDESIPKILVKNCIGGIPQNLGDLNNNGSDDIGLVPQWWQGCWSSFHTWTFSKNSFIFLVDPFAVHCNQREKGIKEIQKDYNRVGFAIIRYTDTNFEVKSKSVKMRGK